MPDFTLIRSEELVEFNNALERNGRLREDFRLDEDVYDPATAEVEAEMGEVIVTCTRTHRVESYHIGRGTSWVADFEDDLKFGKFDASSKA